MDAELIKTGSFWDTTGAFLEWGLIGAGVVLLSITESFGYSAIVSLALLVVFFAERAIRGKLASIHTGIELPIALFVASAGISTLISFEQGAALLQFSRILASVAIFFALADSRRSFSEIIAIGFTSISTVLAIYWPLQNDFSRSPGKLPMITSIGEWLNSVFPAIPGPDIHSNVAAGTLLVSIPFGVCLILIALKSKRNGLLIFSIFQTLILLLGLGMTSSRGAWIALAGITFFSIIIVAYRRLRIEPKLKRYLLLGSIPVFIMLGISFIFFGNFSSLLGQIPDPTGSMQSRLSLWQEGLSLSRDYFFTGSGLQSFWMTHAVYGILVHVPYLAHIHNSFLQIWIEQGIFGAVALCWGLFFIILWGWRAVENENIPLLGWAGLAAVVAGVLHGVVDVVFYVERTLPIVGVLLGFTALIPKNLPLQKEAAVPAKQYRIAFVFLSILLLASFVTFRNSGLASWYANLGALRQSRTELSIYDPNHFDNPNLDQVRQSVNLVAAEEAFKKALSYKAENLTALQRLSMIAMARSDYTLALEWMETAWQTGARDSRTRLLYSDALVAAGYPALAAEIVKGLTWAENRLVGQAWYRYWSNNDYERTVFATQAVVLLNPANSQAVNLLNEAEKFINK